MKPSPWPCLLLSGLLLASCSAPSSPPALSSSPSRTDPISNQVHSAVNQYRASKGKSPLIRHSGLDRLAADHSRYLLAHTGSFSLQGKKVSHFGFENRALAARRHYSMDTVGENVAAGQVGTTQAGSKLLTLWKNSPGHHKQLLQDWTHTGIGSATGPDGTVYCTQLFATLNTSLQQSRDRFAPR